MQTTSSTQEKNIPPIPVTPRWSDNRGCVHFGDTLKEAKTKAAEADSGNDRYDR